MTDVEQIWRTKTDDQLAEAVAQTSEYTEDGQRVIRAELDVENTCLKICRRCRSRLKSSLLTSTRPCLVDGCFHGQVVRRLHTSAPLLIVHRRCIWHVDRWCGSSHSRADPLTIIPCCPKWRCSVKRYQQPDHDGEKRRGAITGTPARTAVLLLAGETARTSERRRGLRRSARGCCSSEQSQ